MHQPTDVYANFSDADFRLGLNGAQTTLGRDRPAGGRVPRRGLAALASHFQSVPGAAYQRVQRRHQKDADQQSREQPADDHEGKRSL